LLRTAALCRSSLARSAKLFLLGISPVIFGAGCFVWTYHGCNLLGLASLACSNRKMNPPPHQGTPLLKHAPARRHSGIDGG
jgi:hypothetical protein